MIMKTKYELTENEIQILKMIISRPGLSRAQIAVDTGLNKSTITYITQKLLKRGYIIFEKGVNDEGRNGTYLYINKDFEHILYLVRSNDKLQVNVANLAMDVLYKEVYDLDEDFEQVIRVALENVKINYPDICNGILAVHGRIDQKYNIVKSPFFEFDIDSIENIFRKFDIDIYIENESNIHALGISRHTDNNIVVNIQIKEGVGAGIIINGKLFSGSVGMAGEIGHKIAIPDGIQCKCGNRGCMEQYISEQNFLGRLDKRLSDKTSIEKLPEIINGNKEFIDEICATDIQILSNVINDLYVLINPDEINITSRIYCNVQDFKSKLIESLTFLEGHHSMINITDYNPETRLKGFQELYFKLMFKDII